MKNDKLLNLIDLALISSAEQAANLWHESEFFEPESAEDFRELNSILLQARLKIKEIRMK